MPSVVEALAEEQVMLPCEALGVPRPSITWQKEGLSIPAGESPLRPVPEGGGQKEHGALPPPRGPPQTCGRSRQPRTLYSPGPSAPPALLPAFTTQCLRLYLSTRGLGWEVREETACSHSGPPFPSDHSESPAIWSDRAAKPPSYPPALLMGPVALTTSPWFSPTQPRRA